MEIRLSEGVVWNTLAVEQSEEAINWYRDNVSSKMAYSKQWGPEYHQPEYDHFLRPKVWIFDFVTFMVKVTKEYISPDTSSWASRGEKVEFIKK